MVTAEEHSIKVFRITTRGTPYYINKYDDYQANFQNIKILNHTIVVLNHDTHVELFQLSAQEQIQKNGTYQSNQTVQVLN